MRPTSASKPNLAIAAYVAASAQLICPWCLNSEIKGRAVDFIRSGDSSIR